MSSLSRLRLDLLSLGLLAAAAFMALALYSHHPADPPSSNVYPTNSEPINTCGRIGAIVAAALYNWFGVAAWGVLGVFSIGALRLFLRAWPDDLPHRILGWSLLMAVACVGLHDVLPGAAGTNLVGAGGLVGAYGQFWLEQELSRGGTTVVLLSVGGAGMLLVADEWTLRVLSLVLLGPFRLIRRLLVGRTVHVAPAADLRLEEPVQSLAFGKAVPGFQSEESPRHDPFADTFVPAVDAAAKRQPIRVNPPIGSKTVAKKPASKPAAVEPYSMQTVELPGLDLLEMAEAFPYEHLAARARTAAQTLEETFQQFNMNVRVVEIDTGPVITQFELELEAGLRLSKVASLADDLAIGLRVPSVRVVAPIPGKNTVGVEVPNDKQVMVRLRELIEASADEASKKRIPVFLGKDVSGRPLLVDLAKMPHLLIAGRTGTGKSVCLNTLILSILMSRTPDQVKMLMIDPKMVELSPYTRVPHLMHPVITDMKKAEALLAWAVDKMEERYDLLARCGVRHLDAYNAMSIEQRMQRLGLDPESEEAAAIPERMPYIVIIADEMADMIMTSGKEVEGHIIRLAQKSRAVGIHLVLATQKPTVDVITGLIKSNLPARISFQVASRMDSRVVLDENGADKLLGNGDMLYLAPGTSKLMRAQGTYVSDDEVNGVIDFYSVYEPQYSRELSQLKAKSADGKREAGANLAEMKSRDDLYEQAVEIIVREGRGSVSLLQRFLGIGYGRAARLIDLMAEDGVVGEYNGSQAREVLYTPEQWAEMRGSPELQDVDA